MSPGFQYVFPGIRALGTFGQSLQLLLLGQRHLTLGLLLLLFEDNGEGKRNQRDDHKRHARTQENRSLAGTPSTLQLLPRSDEAADQFGNRGRALLQPPRGIPESIGLPYLIMAGPMLLPQLRCLGHVGKEVQLLPALVNPPRQGSPFPDDGLVHQFQFRLGPFLTPSHHNRARAYEPVKDLPGLAVQPLQQRRLWLDTPGPLWRDQPQKQFPGHHHLVCGKPLQHAVRMTGQRTSHSAHVMIGRASQHVLRLVPPLPQHLGSKLQQGQRGSFVPDLRNHVLEQGGVIKTIAHRVQGLHKNLLQRFLSGAAKHSHPAQSFPRLRALRYSPQKIVAQGENHAHRAQRIIGCPAHRLHEQPAGVLTLNQGVHLFGLVHHQQHPRAALLRQVVEHHCESGRRLPQLGCQLIPFASQTDGLLPGMAVRAVRTGRSRTHRRQSRRAGAGRRYLPGKQPGSKGLEGTDPGLHVKHGPRTLLSQTGHNTGHDK